jgi:hypothetical protein
MKAKQRTQGNSDNPEWKEVGKLFHSDKSIGPTNLSEKFTFPNGESSKQ